MEGKRSGVYELVGPTHRGHPPEARRKPGIHIEVRARSDVFKIKIKIKIKIRINGDRIRVSGLEDLTLILLGEFMQSPYKRLRFGV